jgi:peptidoglycan/xylan/chitin deacetylase (PgdA/CDA1 family)
VSHLSSLLLLALVTSGPATPSRLIYSGAAQQRWIALTFDAGADRGYAPTILATLERAHVRASFGMTGRWAQQNRDLVRRMARDGDTFINHTYDHRSFTGFSTRLAPLTSAQRTWEIQHADAVVRSITGKSMKPYFRPPYGDIDQAALLLVKRLGYADTIMWTVDSLGWRGIPASLIEQRCLSLARPGEILLMHVGSQSQDGVALPAVISALRKQHYTLVTISQLVRAH